MTVVAIAGAGAWGTALANVAARAGRDVVLCGRDPAHMRALAETRENHAYLPGVRLDPRVEVTAECAALRGAAAVLLAVPTSALRAAAATLAPHLIAGAPLIACAKGIERGTDLFVTEVLAEAAPAASHGVLSGPSFAADVVAGLPTAVTVACRDEGIAAEIAALLGSSSFRLYHSTDVRGVEIGGAAKNVLAIAVGVAKGRRFGASAAAALITRGFAELMRFGVGYGARAETLAGLSGLGDLVLTCSGSQSRNFAFGLKLGAGEPMPPPGTGPLVEGIATAPVLVEMAERAGLDMPIATAVAAILAGRLDIDSAIAALLARPQKAENG